MRNIEELRTTTNRSVYNHAYKSYLDNYENFCSYCKPHRGCNSNHRHYGGYIGDNKNKVTYPSWKLVSKNRKQWMKKPIKTIIDSDNWRKENYITFKWK